MSHTPVDLEDNKDLQEKRVPHAVPDVSELSQGRGYSHRWTRRLLTWGVESRGMLYYFVRGVSSDCGIEGIQPVPPEERTDRQFSKIFFIFFSMNTNILSLVLNLFPTTVCRLTVHKIFRRNPRTCRVWPGRARFLPGYFIL